MLVDPPILVVAVVPQHKLRRLKCPVAIAQGGPHTGVTEANNVRASIAV